jgi:hypothetical protein
MAEINIWKRKFIGSSLNHVKGEIIDLVLLILMKFDLCDQCNFCMNFENSHVHTHS